ncbi:unnamed protein product [Sphenostylis stenocarpa]|uniref:Uncharacterized protein n=1 Tax=Sphenostylis stenocarpa TaxID=92480 RepID=A0AA86SK05_9FABA|nr:unnamed protein product [Sphenostylis stenocarpa]
MFVDENYNKISSKIEKVQSVRSTPLTVIKTDERAFKGLSLSSSFFFGAASLCVGPTSLVCLPCRHPLTIENAHKKGAESTKNGCDSQSKRLGVKIYGEQVAKPGSIIVRQRETKVVVRNIPHMPAHSISDFVDGFFQKSHLDHYIGHQKFVEYAKRRDRLQYWLDYYQLKFERHPDKRPTVRNGYLGLWGGKVVKYYKHAVTDLDKLAISPSSGMAWRQFNGGKGHGIATNGRNDGIVEVALDGGNDGTTEEEIMKQIRDKVVATVDLGDEAEEDEEDFMDKSWSRRSSVTNTP